MSVVPNRGPLGARDPNSGMPQTSLIPMSKPLSHDEKENASLTPAKSNPKKRKSGANEETDAKALLFPDDAPYIDDDDDRLRVLDPKGYSCQQVRRKIKNWVESGAMKVGEFQKALNVSSAGYSNFMRRTGTWDGEGCETYWRAAEFFRKRELQGLPLSLPKSAKKAKTGSGTKPTKATEQELLDVSGVTLPGEESMSVPVFDTCNEVRKKIRDLQAKGVSQAAIARGLSATLPSSCERSVSAQNLRTFMGGKGVMGGNTTLAFYAAYVFFEKKRIKAGKPKSSKREDMESLHGPRGVETEHNLHSGYFVVSASSQPYIDNYGMVRTYQR